MADSFTFFVTVYANDLDEATEVLNDRLFDGDERTLPEKIEAVRKAMPHPYPALPFVSPLISAVATRKDVI